MCAFVDDGLFDAGEPVEDYGAGATFDVVEGGLSEGEAEGDGHGPAGDVVEDVGHVEQGMLV